MAGQRPEPTVMAAGFGTRHLLRPQLVVVDGYMYFGAHIARCHWRRWRTMTGTLPGRMAERRRPAAPLRVCHFVHAPAIGGVETAVAQLQRATRQHLDYAVATLAPARDPQDEVAITRPAYCGVGLNNPLSALLLMRWAMRRKPDIIVASLWRAV